MYGRGAHAYFAGQYQEACDDLAMAIDAGSNDPRVYYFRALANLRLGKHKNADADMLSGHDARSGRFESNLSREQVAGASPRIGATGAGEISFAGPRQRTAIPPLSAKPFFTEYAVQVFPSKRHTPFVVPNQISPLEDSRQQPYLRSRATQERRFDKISSFARQRVKTLHLKWAGPQAQRPHTQPQSVCARRRTQQKTAPPSTFRDCPVIALA